MAKTFSDPAKKFIIRILSSESSSKIYLFSTLDEVVKNYKIVLNPSGEEYFQKDNSLPIEINKKIFVEAAELHFN